MRRPRCNAPCNFIACRIDWYACRAAAPHREQPGVQACLVAGEGGEAEELPSEVDSEGDSLDLESLLSQVRPQAGSRWCGWDGSGGHQSWACGGLASPGIVGAPRSRVQQLACMRYPSDGCGDDEQRQRLRGSLCEGSRHKMHRRNYSHPCPEPRHILSTMHPSHVCI